MAAVGVGDSMATITEKVYRCYQPLKKHMQQRRFSA